MLEACVEAKSCPKPGVYLHNGVFEMDMVIVADVHREIPKNIGNDRINKKRDRILVLQMGKHQA